MPISLIAALFLLAAGPAPAAAPTIDPGKKVCKTIKETGSRLGGKRECRTQAEWDRLAAETEAKARSKMGR